MKKKTRRLHGKSAAEKTRIVLNVFGIETYQIRLEGLMETSDRKAFLCHICDA